MKLNFESYPDLSARDVVFVHGNLGSRRWWHPTRDAWRAAGSTGAGRLLLADWRGCGASPDLPDEVVAHADALDPFARDFVELIERETTGPIDLVGHSLGGLIAARVMSMIPGRIRRAVLLDPVGPRGVIFDDSMYAAFDQMTADPALTRAIILSTIRDAERTVPAALADALAEDAQRAVGGAGRAALAILRHTDLTDALRAVVVPTLVVHGDEDRVIPPADGLALAQALGRATFEGKAGVGHCWNVEDPTAFTRRLREWLV